MANDKPHSVLIPMSTWRRGLIFALITGAFLALGAYAYLHGKPFLDRVMPLHPEVFGKDSEGLVGVGKCLMNQLCSTKFQEQLLPPDLYLYGGIAVLTLLMTALAWPRRVTTETDGTNRFATRKDVERFVETRDQEIINSHCHKPYAPLLYDGYMGRHQNEFGPFLRLSGSVAGLHAEIYGGTGAGKTTTWFRPMILLDAMEGNVSVVFDTKYPNPNDSYVDVRDWFSGFGRPVYVLKPVPVDNDPFRQDSGIQIPLLRDIPNFTKAMEVAELFMPRGLEINGTPDVYISNARRLLAGIYYSLSREPEEKRTFRETYLIANSGEVALRGWFDDHSFAADEIRSSLDLKKDIFNGAINLLTEMLYHLSSEEASQVFAPGPNAVDMQKIFSEPCLLHVVVPEIKLKGGAGQAVFRMLKSYLDQQCLELAMKLGGKLPYPVRFHYDEFHLFGRLPNLASDLNNMRSRNVTLMLGFQNIDQGPAIYQDDWEGIIGNNFGVSVYLAGSFDFKNAETLSERLGKRRVNKAQQSYLSGGVLDQTRRGVGYSETSVVLITADELKRLQFGDAMMEVRGSYPIRTKMPVLQDIHNPLHLYYKGVEDWRKARNLAWKQSLQQAIEKAQAQPAFPELPKASPPVRDPLPSAVKAPGSTPERFQPTQPTAETSLGPRVQLRVKTATKASPQTNPLVSLVDPSHLEAFGRIMKEIVDRQIEIKAEGSRKVVTRYELTDAFKSLDISPQEISQWVGAGFIKQRGPVIYLIPQTTWGRIELSKWAMSATIAYSAEPPPKFKSSQPFT